MKKSLLMLAACLLVSQIAPAQAATAVPAAASDVAAAYERNLHDVVEVTQPPRLLRLNFFKTEGANAADLQRQAAFLRQLSDDDLYRHLVPLYANILNPVQAAELAKLTRSPAFRLRETRVLEANGEPVHPVTFLTQTEVRELRVTDANPSVVAFYAARPALARAIGSELTAMVGQFDRQLIEQATASLRKVREDLDAAAAAGATRTTTVTPVGVPYMDKLLSREADAMIKSDDARRRFVAIQKNNDFVQAFKAESLVTPGGRQRAAQLLENLQAGLASYLKAVDSVVKERDEAGKLIELPANSRAGRGLTNDSDQHYRVMIALGEGYRQLFDEHRRLLAFVAERGQVVEVKAGSLIFSSDADVAAVAEISRRIGMVKARLLDLAASKAGKAMAAQTPAPNLPRQASVTPDGL